MLRVCGKTILHKNGFLFVAEFATGGFTIELPGDLDPIMIHASIPSLGFPPQRLEVGDASLPQTLPREDPDFDLRLIEPATVSGGVMDREAAPDFDGHFGPEHRCQRPLGMTAEIVHD